MSTNYKCIRVSKDTYSRLTKLGSLQDTFDTVIARLVENAGEVSKS